MGQYLSWAANAVLFALCCSLIATTANAIFGAWLTPPTVDASVQVAQTAPSARSWSDRAVILERNLFHSSTLSPPPSDMVAAEEQEHYEETRLPLDLIGTAAAGDPQLSWAAVVDRGSRETLVVSVGEEILEGKAQVVAIERRRVILAEGGGRRELSLDDEEENGKKARPRRPTRTASRSGASRSPRVSQLDRNRFSVSKGDVQAALRNPTSLFSQARILPKYDGGEMVGVEVNAIRPGSLFEEIGLHDGDLITELNGTRIDSPEESAKILRELSEATDISIMVQGADGGPPRQLEVALGQEDD